MMGNRPAILDFSHVRKSLISFLQSPDLSRYRRERWGTPR